jgi:hypothetical protein
MDEGAQHSDETSAQTLDETQLDNRSQHQSWMKRNWLTQHNT